MTGGRGKEAEGPRENARNADGANTSSRAARRPARRCDPGWRVRNVSREGAVEGCSILVPIPKATYGISPVSPAEFGCADWRAAPNDPTRW
jgi:hypothetical protein